jgi:Ca2+-binding RTX toxin-like protein
MRRALTMLSAMAVMVVLAAGVAFAANIVCTTEPCVGTRGDDQIFGAENTETINALAGDDFVDGGDGDDIIYLDRGRDSADGRLGNDTIYGGVGNDGPPTGTGWIAGSEGSDTVYGGKGNDYIDAGGNDTIGSVDYSYGEGGSDTIWAVDGNVDHIDCGENKGKDNDTVYYDEGIDTVTNCEVLNPPIPDN